MRFISGTHFLFVNPRRKKICLLYSLIFFTICPVRDCSLETKRCLNTFMVYFWKWLGYWLAAAHKNSYLVEILSISNKICWILGLVKLINMPSTVQC